MTEQHIGSEYVEVLPDAAGFVRKFEEQTGAKMVEAGRKAGNDWQRGFDTAARGSSVRVRVDTTAARAELAALNRQVASLDRNGQVHALRDGLIALAPAVVPVVGAAGLAGAALASMGVTGALAVKGVRAEMKAGTDEGVRFSAGVNTIKGDLTGLERTAARGILTPFEKSIAQIHADMPAVNADLAQSSKVLGDIGGHLAGALVGGERNFAPALLAADTAVDKLAARFESWATGPGGERFAATLADDFAQVEPVVEDVATAVGHLLSAANGPGLGIVHELDLFAEALDAIPQPILTALLSGLVTWRTYALAAAVANKVFSGSTAQAGSAAARETLALRAQAAAAAAAAEAMNALGLANVRVATTGSLAGWGGVRVAAGAGAPLPIGGAVAGGASAGLLARIRGGVRTGGLAALVAYLTAAAGSNLTAGYQGQDNFGSDIHGGFDTVRDTLTLPFAALTGGTLFGRTKSDLAADQYKRQNDYYQKVIAAENLRIEQMQEYESALAAAPHQTQAASIFSPTFTQAGWQKNEALRSAQFGKVTPAARSAFEAVNRIEDKASLTGAAQATSQLSEALQTRIDKETALFKIQGDSHDLGEGVIVDTDAYKKKMDQLGGSVDKTTAYFQAHKGLLDILDTQQDRLTKDTAHYNEFLTQAGKQYQLNDTQVQSYSAALGLSYGQVTKNRQSAQDLGEAVNRVAGRFLNGDDAMQGWLQTLSQVDVSSDQLDTRVTVLGAGLKALQGITLDMAGANLTAVNSAEQAATALHDNAKSVDENGHLLGQLVKHGKDWEVEQPKLSAGALQIEQSFSGAGQQAISLAQNIYQNEVATKGNAQAVRDAFGAYDGLRSQFISTAEQMHYSKTAAENLATAIYGVPDKDFEKSLKVGDLPHALAGITGQLANLNNNLSSILITLGIDIPQKALLDDAYHKLTSLADANITTSVVELGGTRHGNTVGARGTRVTEGTTSTADDVWARVSKGEWIINAAQSEKHKDLLRAINDGTYGFATGGRAGDPPPSLYIPPKKDGNDTHSSKPGSGPSSDPADKEGQKLASARQSARSDLEAFLSAIGITTNAITAAEHELSKALDKAKVSNDEQAKIQKEMHRLVGITHDITTENERITKAQTHLQNVEQRQQQVQQAARQEAASIQSSIMGLFNLSSAGVQQQVYRDRPAAATTASSFLTDLTSSANTAVKTKGELEQLKGHIPDALYEQLAGNASADQPQIEALAGASPKTLAAIEKQWARLHKAAKGTGEDVSKELFGDKEDAAAQSVRIAKGLLNGVDPAKNPALAKAVKHLSTQLFGAGKETAKGLAEGLIAERTGLRKQLRQIGHELAGEIRDDLAGRNPDHHRKNKGKNNDNRTNSAANIIFNGPVNDLHTVTKAIDYALIKATRRGRR